MPARRRRPTTPSGSAARKIEVKFVDEAGSTAQVVTEYRNLVQRDGVDAVVGYISSGSCLAVTPVAEELKALTVYYDCGTPRIFEETPRKYVFRPPPTATMDNVGAARYLVAKTQGHQALFGDQPELRLGPGLLARFRQCHGGAVAGRQGRQGAVSKTVRRRVRRRDFDAADLRVTGGAHELLGRRSRKLHLPERCARARQADADRRHHGRGFDVAPARQDPGRHHRRRPRAQRAARPRHAAQRLVPQGLHRALRHAADLSVLPDGAGAARARSGVGEGAGQEGRRPPEHRGGHRRLRGHRL